MGLGLNVPSQSPLPPFLRGSRRFVRRNLCSLPTIAGNVVLHLCSLVPGSTAVNSSGSRMLRLAMKAVLALSCVATVAAFPAQTSPLRAPAFITATGAGVSRLARHLNASSLQFQPKLQKSSPKPTCRWLKPQLGRATFHLALMARGGAEAFDAVKRENLYGRVSAFLNKRFFLLGAVAMVSAARIAPTIGATGGLLRPELTVNKAGEISCL